MNLNNKTKKVLKIIGFIIAMILMVVGIFLYYPLIIPIALFMILYEREKHADKKKSSPSPMENNVENFETIDD